MHRYQAQVSDWMTTPPITISPRASLADAYERMLESEVRRLLVFDGELVGIVTQSDIMRAAPVLFEELDAETRLLLTTRTVRDVMTWDPVTVDPEDTVQEAAERMLEYRVSGLPVVDGNRLIGIITESDIFRLVVESWAEDERNPAS